MTETIHLSEWDTLLRFHVEISKVNYDERLLVLSTHGFHELLINTLIEDDLFQILDWFRRLRNKAAHEPVFEIIPAE